MLSIGREWRLRNIVEPLNAEVLVVILKKRLTSRRSAGKSYTCDSSPDEGATAGENVDAARPGCFAASTAPRGDGRVSGAGPSRVGRLAVNVMSLVKASKINIVPVSHGR